MTLLGVDQPKRLVKAVVVWYGFRTVHFLSTLANSDGKDAGITPVLVAQEQLAAISVVTCSV